MVRGGAWSGMKARTRGIPMFPARSTAVTRRLKDTIASAEYPRMVLQALVGEPGVSLVGAAGMETPAGRAASGPGIAAWAVTV